MYFLELSSCREHACLLLPFILPALHLWISFVVSGYVSVVPRVTFLYKEIESAFDNESNKMIEKKSASVFLP